MSEPQYVEIGGVDVTQYVSKVVLNTAGSVPTGYAAHLAGLKDHTLTMDFDNAEGTSVSHFDADLAYFKTMHREAPLMDVTMQVPASRWQRVKLWLQRHGLRRLKVRYVAYRWQGHVQPWPDGDGLTVDAVGPIAKGLEER